jgi:predicted 3-demethylubiquinone-9 3-methyltransferase (glyoxalase superfamily)
VPKITPFLWFEHQAEEAARFYVSIFKNSRIVEASAMTVRFELEGQPFMALNGGPTYRLNEAFSIFVDCQDQAEVDVLWARLCEGGEPGRCGWCKDRYGLSWQIIPSILLELMGDPDPEKARRVTQAMLQMGKIDIAQLEKAHRG